MNFHSLSLDWTLIQMRQVGRHLESSTVDLILNQMNQAAQKDKFGLACFDDGVSMLPLYVFSIGCKIVSSCVDICIWFVGNVVL